MPICTCLCPPVDSANILKNDIIRIMVVGDQMSGKTSMIKKYVHDMQPRHHEITIGVNFELKSVKKEDKHLRLQIFDSGYHLYNELIRNLITNFKIQFIIVCVDLTNPDSFQIIQEWERQLEDLENFDECKILVCGTKADIRNPKSKTSHNSVMSKSSKVINYFETSSDTGQNIDSDYNEDLNRNYLEEFNTPNKRACVRRGGNCDHRPNDCCYQSSCRCNLWGSNCRCQRMGLFQKWG